MALDAVLGLPVDTNSAGIVILSEVNFHDFLTKVLRRINTIFN